MHKATAGAEHSNVFHTKKKEEFSTILYFGTWNNHLAQFLVSDPSILGFKAQFLKWNPNKNTQKNSSSDPPGDAMYHATGHEILSCSQV